ncbi:hypothetical protein ID866_8029 [Astraeus odoratus]|nr:hypothetical protein ID866_8029 [Astraeus odoratus]
MSDMTFHDQESALATPLATSATVPPIEQSTTSQIISTPADPSSTLATSESSPSHILLPIPTSSTNQSQPSFSFSHAFVPADNDWSSLPPEILNADISIAHVTGAQSLSFVDQITNDIVLLHFMSTADGSFVETSSGPAARELKRRYDQYLGVGKDVRSPYAITAFVNQHGKSVYRVGHRDATAPAAEAESKVSSAIDASHNRSLKGRSRMSVHNILSQSKPKAGIHLKPGQTYDSNISGRKLLRRTRSIPDMFGVAASSNTGPSEQPTSTGRTHSHSVTGADMPRHLPIGAGIDVPGPSMGDIFTEAMQWSHTSVPHSPYSGNSTSGSVSGGYIPYPFGPGVSFDAPSRRSPAFFLPLPRALREMQSFESCLTARAGDTPRRAETPDSVVESLEAPSEIKTHSEIPDQSSLSRVAVSPFGDDSDIPLPDPALAPLPETSMHSRYSTEVFDVLQTYRGLPLLDLLSPDSAGETTIKMSLRTDDSAAPRDDPRFVLWGDIQPTSDPDGDDMSLSQGSRTGISSPSASRRGKSRDVPRLPVSADDPTSVSGSRRVIIAATIERWIAHLTSELNYDELLNFFLTYRTYISAVDLCHLLICRFHWSLSGHVTKQDDQVRKIVRVRTFVAIRYWLLTFFVMDFLPNRELRLLLASWLNALIRDPVLGKHQDGLSIVRKLIKVVKDCKEAHTRRRCRSPSARKSVSNPPKPRPTHLLGEKFAEAISKDDDDSDVDLDFVPDERVSMFLGNGESKNTFPSFGTAGPSRTSAITSASAALLQQPLQRNILQQSRASISVSGPETHATHNPPTITSPHRALSRAFVKTIGRLGRWKRVLNSRQTIDTGIAIPANVSAFDLELNATGDLLTVRGGVEQYLKMIEPQTPRTPVHANAELKTSQEPSAATGTPPEQVPEGGQVIETEAVVSPPQPLRPVTEVMEEEEGTETATMGNRPVSLAESYVSTRTHSTESFGSILTSKSKVNPLVAQVHAHPPWRFDVASIDDLELSDTSSDAHVESPSGPSGLRKALRKLPLRRDFEFVRRSVQSVSSMGIRSRDSVASENSVISTASVGGGLGTGIHQWQVNAIVDSLSDDGEDGGVEDALRRLEGQINPQRRKEKALKVDGWVRAIQERMAAGDFGDERPRFFNEDENEDEDEDYIIDQHETGSIRRSIQIDPSSNPSTPLQSTISKTQEDYFGLVASGSATLPTTTPLNEANVADSNPTSPLRTTEAKPAPEDVVPLEILQSRVPSRPSTSHGPSSHGPPMTSPPKLLPSTGRKSHRCWILNFKADVLVHHFSMIDRELFLSIKPEELILDDWMTCQEVDVLDWAQYLKERARWKAESRFSQKTSALAAVRGRFNLMANFVISEVILTHPSERHTLVSKFIRIAIKAYSLSNFHTLAAILAGLRSEWVKKAMYRHWNRVGPWEIQVFQKLSQFVTAEDDFKAMSQAITAMVDAKPMDVRSHASTIMSGSTSDSHSKAKPNEALPSACVPFIGVYLSQLYRYSKLPDLIDPTSPHDPVGMDTHSLGFDSPAHPEVFDSLTPLPPSMQLEPLINVHKQRLIAGVIKDLVAGQHLASRVHFAVDKKVFQKCLKIRGLDLDTLQQVYIMYSDPSAGSMRLSGFIPL